MSEPERAPRLLLVDDESRILSALRRALRREGYEIFAVETTREALALLESESIDLVLSDHKMPGMTGLQFLARVAVCQPDAARLLITGWTEEIPEAEIREVGVLAVINKPWEDSALKETLRRALKDPPSGPQSEPL